METIKQIITAYYLLFTIGILLLFLIIGFILKLILKKQMKEEDEYLNDKN